MTRIDALDPNEPGLTEAQRGHRERFNAYLADPEVAASRAQEADLMKLGDERMERARKLRRLADEAESVAHEFHRQAGEVRDARRSLMDRHGVGPGARWRRRQEEATRWP